MCIRDRVRDGPWVGLVEQQQLERDGERLPVGPPFRAAAAVGPVSYTHLDVYKRQDVESLRDEALALGTLDIWVNNAGAAGVYGPTASTPVDDFTRAVRTNILGTFHG